MGHSDQHILQQLLTISSSLSSNHNNNPNTSSGSSQYASSAPSLATPSPSDSASSPLLSSALSSSVSNPNNHLSLNKLKSLHPRIAAKICCVLLRRAPGSILTTRLMIPLLTAAGCKRIHDVKALVGKL